MLVQSVCSKVLVLNSVAMPHVSNKSRWNYGSPYPKWSNFSENTVDVTQRLLAPYEMDPTASFHKGINCLLNRSIKGNVSKNCTDMQTP
mmetsp:Transcript_11597/g.33371  ORF Transcript_11597/g.33371 Transcript_11597/m.33371 type:complete len:89 (+) Transcript_11597:880-1146(+)